MRFKEWLIEGATSAMHGGFYGLPNKYVNDNMPYGVRSRYVTKDGRGDWQKDPDEDIDADAIFGYRKRPKDKKLIQKSSNSIYRSRDIPVRDNRPDIIY